MPNRSRSLRKKQMRDAKRFILDTSFRDREQAESVCIVTTSRIVEELQRTYPYVHMDVRQFQKGEVIVDSRGQGSFQR